jgi:adenosylmethionine-8-amino-7-oxononanoate aminotransferase
VGAAVAREVLRIIETEALVEASAVKGARLQDRLHETLDQEPAVGEIRGRGLLVGIELVADQTDRRPFPRSSRVTEAVLHLARQFGVLVYSSTGVADGVDGDLIVLGPPFIITDAEIDRIVEVLARAISQAVAEARAAIG